MAKEIIKKWYSKIGFPSSYDEEFYQALENYEIDVNATVEAYNKEDEDGKKNFLYFLYFCEETERVYKEKGISEEILMDTLGDFPRWLDTWSAIKGGLYLGELDWLSYHLRAKLFKLGRLQFCFASHSEFPSRGIKKGDSVIDTHIPADGPLDNDACRKSFDFAREFFAKYYPEYNWEVFSCHSWLLGQDLEEIIGKESNIVKFQKLFNIESQYEGDSIISYTIGWKLKREDLPGIEPSGRFAQKVKELALNGAVFHGGTGYIDR